MDKDLEKFLNKARQIKLSNNEREDLRGKLEEFIWKNPIKIREQKRRVFYLSFISWRVGVAVFAFLLVASSAGASVLATKSLPGDKLYAVKTGLNEEVKTFFAFTEEAKAKVNADLAEVRLLEVEKLAEKGKLDREKREKLEREFKARADKFEAKQKSEDLEKRFEERLLERERALEEVREKQRERKSEIKKEKRREKEQESEMKNSNIEDDFDRQEEYEYEDHDEEEDEDEVEPILKEVRGRIKSKENRERED